MNCKVKPGELMLACNPHWADTQVGVHTMYEWPRLQNDQKTTWVPTMSLALVIMRKNEMTYVLIGDKLGWVWNQCLRPT